MTVMEYVLSFFIGSPAETSSRQSHHADLLIAGIINNSLSEALAPAEGTVCCRVKAVVKIYEIKQSLFEVKRWK